MVGWRRLRKVKMNFRWKGPVLCVVGLMGLGSLVYGRTQAAQPVRPQMAEEAFKDIRVLKGIPVDEFMDVMGMFSASLGYCCTDCHVKEAVGNIGAFALQTPKIQTARRMIAMVNTINMGSFKLEIYAKAPNQRTTIVKMPEEDSV